MWRQVCFLLIVLAVAATPATSSAALPPEILSAGVTEAQWSAVQIEVKHAASEKRISERALNAVCLKMGVSLAKGKRLQLADLISLISGRADEIAVLNQQLSLQAKQNASAASDLLKQAADSIDTGDLDQAHIFLHRARDAAKGVLEEAQRREAGIDETDAKVLAAQLDYLGAAKELDSAANELPASDSVLRWTYLLEEARALALRGSRFDELAPLSRAVELIQQKILPLISREAEPIRWGETQDALGGMLWVIGDRGDYQALEGAVKAQRSALEIFSKEKNPRRWAAVENDLGLALDALGRRGDDQALNDAVSAYRAALEVRTRDRFPKAWAQTEANLNNTLQLLGMHGDRQARLDSIAAARSVLEFYNRSREPLLWGAAEVNLGTALERAAVTGDPQILAESAAAFRLALLVLTKESDPFSWAQTSNNLCAVLAEDADHVERQALEEGAAACRSALEVYTKEQDPQHWAQTYSNLGFITLLLNPNDDQNLTNAESAFHSVLEVYTRDKNPFQWAVTHYRLGLAQLDRSQHGDRRFAQKAVDYFNSALLVWTSTAYPRYSSMATSALASAKKLLSDRAG